MESDFVGKRDEANLESLLGSHDNDHPMMMMDDEEGGRQGLQQTANSSSLIGEKQPPQYRDVWAAAVFVLAQLGLGYLAVAWGIPALNNADADSSSSGNNNNNNGTTGISFAGIVWLCLASSTSALLLSAAALGVLMRAAHQLIQISLLLTILCDLVVTVFLLSKGFFLGAAVSLLFLALAACYAAAVWHRVPFAASNLMTAVTAVQANGGLILVSYGITMVVNLYSAVWLLAWLGVYARSADCSAKNGASGSSGGECISHMHPLVVFGLLLCYYWGAEVGKNVLAVTTAGVVGTWWFAPDEAGTFCSPAVTDSLARASTYSAGSICLGSLLTATLQVLHHLAVQARRHGRGNDMLLCVLECIVSCLERLVTYFNKWAFVYIGLYGYDYLTSGKKVMDLFMDRGWTTIINDNLVARVLTLVSLVIGALTGCVGLLLSAVRPGWVEEFGDGSSFIAFSIPALIGTAMAYILMSVVASAVDTVVVAFCEAPLEFERNHPGLHAHMSTAWRQVYPEEFGR